MNTSKLLTLVTIALGFGGVASAAERTPSPTTTLTAEEGDDERPTDLDSGGPDSSDPDPGQPDQLPDDICVEREPLDPADDFWWEPPFERPDAAGDLKTDAVSGEIWLTAASPNQLGAYITGDRVWHWDANPADPIWQFRVDPTRPIEYNAKLELHLRAQPGYDYDIYFWFGPGPDMNGASVRINNEAIDAHPTMAPEGSGWTSLSGPEQGEEPDNHIISLDMYGSPDEEARWSVTAIQIVTTPEQ